LVSIVFGAIYDVAVDIRKNSPCFGRWIGIELSSEKKNSIYIPEGFAHGFSVLSDTAEINYYCTGEYSPKHEAGIIYNDPDLNINWKVSKPILSDKDSRFPLLNDADNNF